MQFHQIFTTFLTLGTCGAGTPNHVSLRFTGTGEKGIPLPPAPFSLAYKVKFDQKKLPREIA